MRTLRAAELTLRDRLFELASLQGRLMGFPKIVRAMQKLPRACELAGLSWLLAIIYSDARSSETASRDA